MKIIKRTTIKIRRRELVIGGSREENGEEKIERCPTCHLPLSIQKSLDENKPCELPAANETDIK